MLIEFRVKNFRSLRDEQVLSLVASKDKTLLNTHTKKTGINAVPTLLNSAVIYGANASGKSNLIKALQYMRNMVRESAIIHPAQSFNVKPFQLDTVSVSEPCAFETTFLLNGVRYQYGFAITTHRIISEYLLVYKAPKPQRWFERYFDSTSGNEIYEFSPHLKGPKHLWEKSTRSNSLFLSMAVQLNSDSLRPVFDWFSNQLIIFNEQQQLQPKLSIEWLKQPEQRQKICDFLACADISIADITVESRKMTKPLIHVNDATENIESRIENIDIEEHQISFKHITKQGEAIFNYQDESSGTQMLLCAAAPILDILNKGLTLIVDELDTHLHTLLVRHLINLFHNSEINRYGAQLIFTTHDTGLLDEPNLFRRDQIWFMDKKKDQSSALIALSEFIPRKNEALEHSYLIGRYGAIPFISENLGLNH